LLRCQNPNGSWPAFAGDGPEGSWVTALAVVTLIRLAVDWKAIEQGVSWLLEVRGRESHWLVKWRYRIADRNVRFDPDKYGWPWTTGTSSWVVPTSYSLIALGLFFTCCRPESVDVRMKKALEMLFDRACPGGGWNAGNGVVYDVPLQPHADTTALALLALLPHRGHPVVKTCLDWLERQRDAGASIYGLSWMAMGLAAHNRSFRAIMERLIGVYAERGLDQDCQTLALTRLAVQMADGANPFRSS
jgi:hypothetical protein